MFCVNDIVMYGNTGVCRVEDIRREKFSQKECLYYILKPMAAENSTVYCPVNSDKIKMRKLLSKEEIDDLIRLTPNAQTTWIENDTERKEKFSAILKEGEPGELARLLKTLYFHREEKIKAGKKFHAADEKTLKEAEKIMYEEFAHVLQISEEEVVPFILKRLGKNAE